MEDASSLPDTGTDAFVVPDSCDMEHLHSLDGVMGSTVSVSFDTSMTETRPRDLGLNCGNTAAEVRWAPQEVVEFHVPGTGPVSVQFSAANDMTQIDFNALIQVRSGGCREVPPTSFPPSCFNEAGATGGVQAMGGDTLYFIVTGYADPEPGEVDEGTIHVEFTVGTNVPPTLTSGTAVLAGPETVITVEATDPDGPIAGFVMSFLTAAGRVDINGDGTVDDNDILTFGFDDVSAASPYTGTISIGMEDGYRIADYCRTVGCTQFGISVFDDGFAGSGQLLVDVEEAEIVGLGGTCDATHVCGGGLVCGASDTCQATPEATAACGAAMDFTIPLPTTIATNQRVTGTIPAGMGVFSSDCGATTGRERIWRLTVPPGRFDVRLTTDVAGTAAATDTVMYVRSVCEDSSSQLPMGCDDDIDTPSMRYHSQLAFQDLAEGQYYVFVETYNASTAAYGLSATLVPVLDPGVECDPAGLQNRCGTGTCPSGAGSVCPPPP